MNCEVRGSLPLTPNFANTQLGATNESPKKKKVDRYAARTPDSLRISMSSRSTGIEQDTLHMLLESPWAITGAPYSPRSSLEVAERSRVRPKLHIKHSSSTLALHREPSPGYEEQTIDTIIDQRPLCGLSNFGSTCGDDKGSVTGRITPGQRMAERFLKERSAPRGSGAATPCSEAGQDDANTGATRSKLDREITPAFL